MTSLTLRTELQQAVDEIHRVLPGRVSAYEDPAGIAVAVAAVALSERWAPRSGTLWYVIPYHYPDAAIYPFYVTDATPTGGMIAGLQPAQWRGQAAIQVSLRHHNWNPALDTALGSALQAQAWLAAH